MAGAGRLQTASLASSFAVPVALSLDATKGGSGRQEEND
jgi:hypothetical protein